jgi:hypothetical protein
MNISERMQLYLFLCHRAAYCISGASTYPTASLICPNTAAVICKAPAFSNHSLCLLIETSRSFVGSHTDSNSRRDERKTYEPWLDKATRPCRSFTYEITRIPFTPTLLSWLFHSATCCADGGYSPCCLLTLYVFMVKAAIYGILLLCDACLPISAVGLFLGVDGSSSR